MCRVLSPTQRLWVISVLLVALVARALIPAGFMPATDRPLSFQICPDGFPAALLGDVALAGAALEHGDAAAMPRGADGAAPMPAGHHHHGGAFTQDGAALPQSSAGGALTQGGAAIAQTSTGGSDASFLHASHQVEAALGHARPSHDSGALAHAGHHHDGPLHNHGVAGGEHCVFAAVAGVFALAFAATFFAPAATISAPDVDYFAPTFQSPRFRIPQPRGPPALS